MVKFKIQPSGEAGEATCTYRRKSVVLELGDGLLRVIERRMFGVKTLLEVELKSIEEMDFKEGRLRLKLETGEIIELEGCENISGIIDTIEGVLQEKELERRKAKLARELYGRAMEIYGGVKKLLGEVYPAIIEVARYLKDIPDYNNVIGKANHLASIVDGADEIVRALRVYDPIRAHRLLVELSQKLYYKALEEARSNPLGDNIVDYTVKLLDLGVLLNTVIAKIYAGEEYGKELGEARKLIQELLGIDPGIPDQPRPEQLYGKLSLILDKAEEKYRELARKLAGEEASKRISSTG